MCDQWSVSNCQQIAKDKINIGLALCHTLDKDFNGLTGVLKLRRRIISEVRYLQKGLSEENIRRHVCSSNISYLESIVNLANRISEVTAVLKVFKDKSGKRITVDIVGNGGSRWYKVISRHPKMLHYLYSVGGKEGRHSLEDIGCDFIQMANVNHHFFSSPVVCFAFVKGVSTPLASALSKLGIEVNGECINPGDLTLPDFGGFESSSENKGIRMCSVGKCLRAEPSYKRVNLDVTCMIAYASSTSNGHCNYDFNDDFLTKQAESERRSPIKPILEKYFEGSELIVCNEAVDHMKTILETVGGPREKDMGLEFVKRCTIVESDDSILQGKLKIGGRIKKLSRIIFSTGIYYSAPTITSNRGFIRAAQNQGIEVAALLHDPRALTEQKEGTAKEIS